MEIYLLGCLIACIISMLIILGAGEVDYFTNENISFVLFSTLLSWLTVTVVVACAVFVLTANDDVLYRLHDNLQDWLDKHKDD